jgi:hypothetical protein
VGYHFLLTGPVLCFYCAVVVALDPELEISSSQHHCVIGLFVIIEFLKIRYIAPDITAANRNYQVDDIPSNDHPNARIKVLRLRYQYDPSDNSPNK